MTRALIVLMAAATISTVVVPAPAQAGDGGAIAGAAIGGLVVGGMIGAAAAQQPQPRYYAPAPVYGAAPVYAVSQCYWTRGEPVWDDYRGVWVRPRVQVCD